MGSDATRAKELAGLIERIPESDFAAAHLNFSRQIATMLCAAIAEGGATMDAINKRLGKRRGWTESIIAKLLDGRQQAIDPVGTILWAAGGFVIDFGRGTISFRKAQINATSALSQEPQDAQ